MNTNRIQGFTLIELMVTLVVAAVVLTLGIPAFQEMIRGNRITNQTNIMVTALNMARAEALKRGGTVTLCKRNSGGTACNNAANWEAGWLLFSDLNGNGVFEDDGDTTLCEAGVDDCLIQSFMPVAGVTIRTSGTNYKCWMQYQANGLPRGSGSACGGGLGTDTFRICREGSTDTVPKVVVVSNTGRIRTTDNKDKSITCP